MWLLLLAWRGAIAFFIAVWLSSAAFSQDKFDEFSFAYGDREQTKCATDAIDQLLDKNRHRLFVYDKGVFSQEVKFELMFKTCEG